MTKIEPGIYWATILASPRGEMSSLKWGVIKIDKDGKHWMRIDQLKWQPLPPKFCYVLQDKMA